MNDEKKNGMNGGLGGNPDLSGWTPPGHAESHGEPKPSPGSHGLTTLEVPAGVVKVRRLLGGMAGKEFNLKDVMPIPSRAKFIIRVDGRDYAGFLDKAHMLEALHLWRQRWPAAEGKHLDMREAY